MKNYMVFGVFMSVAAAAVFSQDNNIFIYKLGSVEVITMVENRGQGNPSVLIDADAGLLQRYMPGGSYQSEVNTFLIRSPGSTVLVDTGFGTTLFENLAKLGIRPEQVDAVLVTHMHGDHIGGLQRDGRALFPNAKLYVAEQEKAYWTDDARIAALPENQRRGFLGAKAALAPYGERLNTFLPGELGRSAADLLPGIKAYAAFGHTPGHTVFMVSSGGKDLLIWGDLVHVMDVQIPFPGISVRYDTDPAAAAESRKKVFEYAAENNIPAAGMHLVYPAIGFVSAAAAGAEGAYRFVQAEAAK